MLVKGLKKLSRIINAISNWNISELADLEAALAELNLTDEEVMSLVDSVDARAMAGKGGLIQRVQGMTDAEVAEFTSDIRSPFGNLPEREEERIDIYVRVGRYIKLRIAQGDPEGEWAGAMTSFFFVAIEDIFGNYGRQISDRRNMIKGVHGQYEVKKTWVNEIRKFCREESPSDWKSLFERIMKMTRDGLNVMSYSAFWMVQTSDAERNVLKKMAAAGNNPEFGLAMVKIIALVVEFLKKFDMKPFEILGFMGVPDFPLQEGIQKAMKSDKFKNQLLAALRADMGESFLLKGGYEFSDLIAQIAEKFNFPSETVTIAEALRVKAEIDEMVAKLIPAGADAGGLEVILTPVRLGSTMRAVAITYKNIDGEMVALQVVPPFGERSELIHVVAHESGHGWHARLLGTKLWDSYAGDQKEEFAIAVQYSVSAALETEGKSAPQFPEEYANYRQLVYGMIQFIVWQGLTDGKTAEDVFAEVQNQLGELYTIDLGATTVSVDCWHGVVSNLAITPEDGLIYVIGDILGVLSEESSPEAENADAVEEEAESPAVKLPKTLREALELIYGKKWIQNPEAIHWLAKTAEGAPDSLHQQFLITQICLELTKAEEEQRATLAVELIRKYFGESNPDLNLAIGERVNNYLKAIDL